MSEALHAGGRQAWETVWVTGLANSGQSSRQHGSWDASIHLPPPPIVRHGDAP